MRTLWRTMDISVPSTLKFTGNVWVTIPAKMLQGHLKINIVYRAAPSNRTFIFDPKIQNEVSYKIVNGLVKTLFNLTKTSQKMSHVNEAKVQMPVHQPAF